MVKVVSQYSWSAFSYNHKVENDRNSIFKTIVFSFMEIEILVTSELPHGYRTKISR